MRVNSRAAAAVLALPLIAPARWAALAADANVVVEHNDEAHASQEFKFPTVPPPSTTDAAAGLSFTVLDGKIDPNSYGVAALTDGVRPGSHDAPNENFFFGQRHDGGRIVLDLGRAVQIGQINTYSWHTDDRAPQVYFVYGADGAAKGFSAAPKRQLDPENAGWEFIAAVDTRPEQAGADPGGQYGVSISGERGKSLGSFRYLLFDIHRTEQADAYGNTFFSEIDVIPASGPGREGQSGAH